MPAAHSDFLPKKTTWKGQKSSFTKENPDKHYLSQVFKVNMDIECKWNLIYVGFLQKICNTSLIPRKTSDKTQYRDTLYKTLNQYYSKLLRPAKTKEVWESKIAKRNPGLDYYTTMCVL